MAEEKAENIPGAPKGLTYENAEWFENSQGRKFPATDVLRRLARRQKLVPCYPPEEEKPAGDKPAAKGGKKPAAKGGSKAQGVSDDSQGSEGSTEE